MSVLGKTPQKMALKPFGFAPIRAPNRARTGDLLIKSQMLYQLSYGCGVKLLKIHFTFKAIYPAF